MAQGRAACLQEALAAQHRQSLLDRHWTQALALGQVVQAIERAAARL